MLGGWLPGAVDLVAAHLPGAGTVVDLGAGTGTGALALARRLPRATVVAVDRSPAMLAHLRTAAAAAGVADRVRTLEADLDAGWPLTGRVDAVWAASSLHHLADADRVLREAHAALRPGGVAVVVELDEQVRLLTDALAPGLASRLAQAASTWNVHPDWGPHLERAGFELLDVRHVATEAVDARFGRAWLALLRSTLADRLAPADVTTLDRLLAQHPATLDALPVRAERTVWLARRPHAGPAPAARATPPTPPTSPTTHDGGAR
ncbi:trans-aconitate 2-methyltransferase [Cellulomonas sp. JZ18]|uniref:class I SAM-dependent methyltransferase n=1 Tax=Cellulomonas sp. JZ18 TaxID=2654191 RepID=UPI0018AFE5AD|nr:class I SAM-dependent methyltransferase [Cellulomonas sp. JZ18]